MPVILSRMTKSTSSGAGKDGDDPPGVAVRSGLALLGPLGTEETGTAQGCSLEAVALMLKVLEGPNMRRVQGLVLPCSTSCCGAARPPCTRSTSAGRAAMLRLW